MAAGAPPLPLGVDPLIAEAKARARRRRLTALGAIVVAAAVAAGTTLATRTSPRAPAISSSAAGVSDRASVWDFGNAGGGVTWAINGRDFSVTANGGRGWRVSQIPAPLRFPGYFSGVRFVDHRHGWLFGLAQGGGGVAYRTADGGRTWERLSVPRAFVELDFVNAKRGYLMAAGRRRELFATRDGGMSWRLVSRLGLVRGAGVTFVTARRGFVETSRTLLATADGGRTWSRELRVAAPVAGTSLLAPTVFGPAIVVPKVVPVADPVDGPNRLYMYVSRDDGTTWSVREAPKPIDGMGGRGPSAPSLSVVSPTIWIAAGGAALFVTTDAGRTWRTVRPTGLPRGWDFHLATGFTSLRDGWALFSRPRRSDILMRTTDGGRHWIPAGPLRPKRARA